ncbi:alpha-glucan family phosphorylase [bacterium]|nr:alpha-glucan family phosphorylase [bacterium]
MRTFSVIPALPDNLTGLRDLAHNFWWAWNPDAFELFRRLDPDVWTAVNHNPVRILAEVSQKRMDRASADAGYVAAVERERKKLQAYLEADTWFHKEHGGLGETRIAYFSLEFAVTECLPIYAGGLGVLAGDHLKSASDIGLPLVGVGLLYRQGYFHQYLGADGWQQEVYPEHDFYTLPLELIRDAEGNRITIEVTLPGRTVKAQLWRAHVGRIPLILLDTNLRDNSKADCDLTAKLYGGDRRMRMCQEILLGIGGVRALAALGIRPEVYHMNEGHSAFLALERARTLMAENGVDFAAAAEAVAAQTVFTTHTPVPAGNETFDESLMQEHLRDYSRTLGLSWDEFMALGRQNAGDHAEPFCLTVLALRLSNSRNAVSQLHGRVSRRMWQNVWPGTPLAEVPIDAITNGVHIQTWISRDMEQLLERYLAPDWVGRPLDHSIWEGVDRIPNAELWRTHERRRERLVSVVRKGLRRQLTQRGASPREMARADSALDPEALTIGFARRFATYKRATLLFRDVERLRAILNQKDRPVQLIFAGKAHPHDNEGKAMIRRIVELGRTEGFRGEIVFLEDYDLSVAHYLAAGVDVWLNTPRRPLEASGTSGMKIAMNGGLNCSILDGWWCEGYTPENGWAIGRGEEYENHEAQDTVESQALYDLLETELIPLFYERASDGVPHGWVRKMKSCLRTLAPYFNTNRMVHEYTEQFYVSSIRRGRKLLADGLRRAADLAAWKAHLRERWGAIRFVGVTMSTRHEFKVGGRVPVKAKVKLGDIRPDEVSVQVFEGRLNAHREIAHPNIVTMTCENDDGDGVYTYAASIPCADAGRHGFVFRILPEHQDLANPHDASLIFWA